MEEQSGADLSGRALFIVGMQSRHTVLSSLSQPATCPSLYYVRHDRL